MRAMGFQTVYNLGGLKEWKEGGGPVEEPLDQGMGVLRPDARGGSLSPAPCHY